MQEAIDSARAAVRGGAAEVTIVSLEEFDEMPVLRSTQGHEEFEEAQREGIRFVTRRGPMRFTGNGHEVEAKPGGHQRFTMVNDADPTQTSSVEATFVEVVENELLVGEEDVSTTDAFPGDTMRLRIEFHDESGNKTRVVLTQGPYSPEWESDAREGWGSSFTKLDTLLAAS